MRMALGVSPDHSPARIVFVGRSDLRDLEYLVGTVSVCCPARAHGQAPRPAVSNLSQSEYDVTPVRH